MTCLPRRTKAQPRPAWPPARSVSQPSPLLVGALVLVLGLRARGHCPFPGCLVAVIGRVLIRRRVGLALIAALLVVDHLRPLAACGKSKQQRADERERGDARHDLPPGAAGVGAGADAGAGAEAACGAPYAESQPHGGPLLDPRAARMVTRLR